MLFSSVVFILFSTACTGALLRTEILGHAQNMLLLVASLFFYAWGEPWFVLIMLASICFNYVFALLVDKFRERRNAAYTIITMMLIVNLGMLFVFKYLAFALRIVNENTSFGLSIPNIALPLGISFFTFHGISYVIDVYRGHGAVQKNLFYVALYISFFPQLVAGPILRYNTIADQMVNRKESWDKFAVGCCRFIVGLGKRCCYRTVWLLSPITSSAWRAHLKCPPVWRGLGRLPIRCRFISTSPGIPTWPLVWH